MTIKYACDGPGCEAIVDEDDPRIALEVVNEPIAEEPAPEYTQFGETDGSWSVTNIANFTELRTFGFSGTHHFHSAECLAAWATARHVNEGS